jgi:hypothetical protein
MKEDLDRINREWAAKGKRTPAMAATTSTRPHRDEAFISHVINARSNQRNSAGLATRVTEAIQAARQGLKAAAETRARVKSNQAMVAQVDQLREGFRQLIGQLEGLQRKLS